ncbi:MAG: hypothetical protein JWO83_1682 [Caulobacteraceae bacterium]|nr:hypothetical protein [Caulobacteraceae bacterium]
MPPHPAIPRTHPSDVWLARGAIVLIAALQLLFVNPHLTFGPRWMAPEFEMAMLLPLSVATAWSQQRARLATEDRHWEAIARHRRWIRVMSLALTLVVMVINFEALVSVMRHLLHGAKGPTGQSLLIDALNIWFTNVVVFALWYWTIDRGGSVARELGTPSAPDFLFPQMLGEGDQNPDWTPGFFDYFYVSFTNATAFSPTDTMPLTVRAKLLMAVEAFVSLITVGLVAARAVNILS